MVKAPLKERLRLGRSSLKAGAHFGVFLSELELLCFWIVAVVSFKPEKLKEERSIGLQR